LIQQRNLRTLNYLLFFIHVAVTVNGYMASYLSWQDESKGYSRGQEGAIFPVRDYPQDKFLHTGNSVLTKACSIKMAGY